MVATRGLAAGAAEAPRRCRLTGRFQRRLAVLLGLVVLLVLPQLASASTTTTTYPSSITQPSPQPVHLVKGLPPLPTIRAALSKQYRAAVPLLNAGLEVFESIDENGRRVRITNLHGLQSQNVGTDPNEPGGTLPGDPGDVISSLSGTVIDSSGRSWDLNLQGPPNFSSGGLDLQGLCGKGRPAPASQQSPGAVNYPCKMIQIAFGPGGLNPRTATIAQWTTVKSVTTITLPTPGRNQV
jgi:hypothetical protein